MKTLKLFAALAIMASSFAACGNQAEEQQKKLDSLMQACNMSQSELTEYLDLVNSISESLDYIQQAEGEIYKTDGDATPQAKRAAVKEKVKRLSEVVKEQREKLATLEEKVKKGGASMAKLQALVNSLKESIEEKEALIADLNLQIEQKNIDINNLTEHVGKLTTANEELTSEKEELTKTVEEKNEAITNQTNKMNEAFIKIATRSELKAAGILESNGFLSKAKLTATNVRTDNFQQVDMRTFKEVTIPSKGVKVLSQMPASSYSLLENGNTTTLVITDPAAFWSVSKFLVIQKK